ncbi:MAG: 6-pyruvoyl trahydropterin synthase family protein [Bdellovibrionales bacterium]
MILSFRYRFEAAHRFTDASSKCSTPHGHSWWVTLSLSHEASAVDLNKNFAADFKDLKTDWKNFIDEEMDHFFFANSEDPLIASLNTINPDLRIKKTPGDPTTEVLASLLFKKAESLFLKSSAINVDSILLEETPTNSVRVSKEDADLLLGRLNTPSNNWWS